MQAEQTPTDIHIFITFWNVSALRRHDETKLELLLLHTIHLCIRRHKGRLRWINCCIILLLSNMFYVSVWSTSLINILLTERLCPSPEINAWHYFLLQHVHSFHGCAHRGWALHISIWGRKKQTNGSCQRKALHNHVITYCSMTKHCCEITSHNCKYSIPYNTAK